MAHLFLRLQPHKIANQSWRMLGCAQHRAGDLACPPNARRDGGRTKKFQQAARSVSHPTGMRSDPECWRKGPRRHPSEGSSLGGPQKHAGGVSCPFLCRARSEIRNDVLPNPFEAKRVVDRWLLSLSLEEEEEEELWVLWTKKEAMSTEPDKRQLFMAPGLGKPSLWPSLMKGGDLAV